MTTWKQYVTKLFCDTRSDPVDFICEDTGPAITRSEVYHAIRNAKTRKTVGPDDIPVEGIKVVEEYNLYYIVSFFNVIYNSGTIPFDWLKSTFIALAKLGNPNYPSVLSYTQFGFRSGLGTRDALFGYQVLVQRCWDMNKHLFFWFIDYEKAFDRVQHDKLIEVLQRISSDFNDRRFIKNL